MNLTGMKNPLNVRRALPILLAVLVAQAAVAGTCTLGPGTGPSNKDQAWAAKHPNAFRYQNTFYQSLPSNIVDRSHVFGLYMDGVRIKSFYDELDLIKELKSFEESSACITATSFCRLEALEDKGLALYTIGQKKKFWGSGMKNDKPKLVTWSTDTDSMLKMYKRLVDAEVCIDLPNLN